MLHKWGTVGHGKAERMTGIPRSPSRFWVGLWIAALAVASHHATETDRSGPRIRFDLTMHDFGEIRSDEKVGYSWVFHNDGDMPLRIQRTRTSCGCTAGMVEEGEVAPGSQGILEVTFDGAGQHGSVRKTVSVFSNDPVNPLVRLTIRAKVKSTEILRASGDHPPISGQSLLMGECATCHSQPAHGKSDQPLYEAVCAMCHGPRAEGETGMAPSLRSADYLASRTDEELATGIAYGTANPRMPGFSEVMGGPLSEEQIRSLVELIRKWGPLLEKSPQD